MGCASIRTGLFWPKLFSLVFSFCVVQFLLPFRASGGETPEVFLSSSRVSQGDLVLLRIGQGERKTPRVVWMEREIPMETSGDGLWWGFLGVDLRTIPKGYPLRIGTIPAGREKRVDIHVESKDYGERRLSLPKALVELDAPTLERVNKEAAVMRAVLDMPPSAPLWKGAFLPPLVGDLSGTFGRRNIINGQVRSPHSGIDLKAERGAPVRAINHGRVVLVANHFFSGISVMVDHGGGIKSMYFHLDRAVVREKQNVEKGEILGRVGSTGRSTGPHLHLGVRLNGARVDPLRLIELSKALE